VVATCTVICLAPYVAPEHFCDCDGPGPYYRWLVSIHHTQTLGLPLWLPPRPTKKFTSQTQGFFFPVVQKKWCASSSPWCRPVGGWSSSHRDSPLL